jgi:hypothetical protein
MLKIVYSSWVKLILLLLAVFFAPTEGRSQELLEVVRHVKVQAEDAGSAKQLLMDKAIEDLSVESIEGLIGQEKTQRSKDLIKNKVIKQSGRYVLSVRAENLTRKGDNFEMDVQAKLSLKGLRSLLLEQGLLYQMEGPPKVLPVVQVMDRISGRRYSWWQEAGAKEDSFLLGQADVFHKALQAELQNIGFYTMAPISGRLAQSLPDVYRGQNLQKADTLFLGDYFKSSIVVRGQVLFRAKVNSENLFVVDVRLEALHSGNGRLMAEVVRSYETESGSFRPVIAKKFLEVAPKLAADLSAQLTEAWKRGTFGASVIQLAVVGKVSPRELEDFKKTVVLQVRDIKALRERLIEARKTTFEVDSSALPQQLAQAIRAATFAKYKVNVEEVSAEGLTIKVETR